MTGKPTITVGSVTLNNSMAEMMQGYGGAAVDNLDRLLSGFDRGEYDMVAIGRAMIGKAQGDDFEAHTPKGKRSYLVRKLVTIHFLLENQNGSDKEE